MIPLGLSAADRRALNTALVTPGKVRVRVSARLLDGTPVEDLTPFLADGQVDVDNTGSVTRSASLTFLDEHRSLPFDTDSPASTALFLDRMIYATYDVLVNGDWVSVPIFNGPVTGLSRDGDEVTVACQGKELLARAACWTPLVLPKHMKKTDAIIRVLSERAGEKNFDVPDLAARLPKAIALTRQSVPWHVARARIAHGMGRQLFYDGSGACRLRTVPGVAGFSFTGQSHVTSPIRVTYSGDAVNAVQVVGGIPKGAKRHVVAVAVAPANHPLSPQRLGRNGVPRHLGKFVADDSIKTTAEALAVAKRNLADGLLQGVDVQFECVPVPFLDPDDLCHVATDDGSVTFRLQKFSLPLVIGDDHPMTVGYNRHVSLGRAHRHGWHPPKHRPGGHHR